tara:strand:+ start:552 stop:782 length:231 start_codon:yes stop_codon:yes gene_type:complete
MIIASGNCTITATGEALCFLKKECDSFTSSLVELELDSIGSITIGDTLSLGKMYFKVDKITDNKIFGHTIIKENKQ